MDEAQRKCPRQSTSPSRRRTVQRCNLVHAHHAALTVPPSPLSLSDSASRLQRTIMSPIRLELNAIHRHTYKITPPRPTHSKAAVSVCNNRFFTLLPSRSSVLSRAGNFNRRSRLPLSVDSKNKGKGPYLNDVYTERGGGGSQNADECR